MKIGAVNNFENEISDEIRLIAANGFDFIDLTLEPMFKGAADPDAVKKVISETGIEVIGHTSAFLPLIFPLKTIREAALDELLRYVDFFCALGIEKMNIHPSVDGCLMSQQKMIKYNKEVISKVNEVCRAKGIKLMVETVMKPFNTPEVFEELLSGIDGLMVHLDIGHCNVCTDRNLVEEFFSVFGKRIEHIHCSDNFGNRDDHLPLGCGSIHWKDMISIIKKYGYDSTLTLEVFSQDRRYLLESKAYLERLLLEYDKKEDS